MANYKGNNDFRGYVAANAPQYLPYVGNDGGINMAKLKGDLTDKAGQAVAAYQAPGLPSTGDLNHSISSIGDLYNQFQADQVSQAAAGNAKPADPNLDPTHIANLRGEIGNMMQVFKQAFDQVYAKVDQMAQDKKNQTVHNYQVQQGGLDKNYGNTAVGIDNAESAHGAFNSSYRATQQGAAKDAYSQATDTLSQGENSDLATIGQTANVQKAQLQAGTPQYNTGDYNTVSDLLNVKNAVNTAIGNLNVSGAGIGTTGGFKGALDAIAPSATDTGSQALKAQLDKLAGTNAPSDAKTVIAQHAINTAGADPAWLDYFQKQLTGNGSAAPATG